VHAHSKKITNCFPIVHAIVTLTQILLLAAWFATYKNILEH
jgi:hypothetical protein